MGFTSGFAAGIGAAAETEHVVALETLIDHAGRPVGDGLRRRSHFKNSRRGNRDEVL